MSDLRTAAQQALEALGTWEKPPARLYRVMDNLRATLAQERAEPIAWLQPKTVDAHLRPDLGYETCSKTDYGAFPVYRVPPQRQPLTEEEIYEMYNEPRSDAEMVDFARAIEQAHGIVTRGDTKERA